MKQHSTSGHRWSVLIATLALSMVAACGGEGAGEYPTENFRWIVPYSAGGGFDTYSRGFAEIMSANHLPEGIDIAVENLTPFAEGMSQAFNAEDEYTLAILPMPATIAQEIQFPDQAQWTTEEFTVLGSIEENAYVVYTRADGPYQTIEDLMAGSGMTAITVERGSSSALATAIAIRTLDLDADITFGAEGSQEGATALVRGDVDFIVYGASDVVGFIDSGDLIPLLFLGTEDQRPEELEFLQGVPSLADIGFPDAAGAVTEMRMVAAPPDLSEEAEGFLRQAVEATLEDPDFHAWAEEADRPLVPRDGESARQALESQINTMEELVPQLIEQGNL